MSSLSLRDAGGHGAHIMARLTMMDAMPSPWFISPHTMTSNWWLYNGGRAGLALFLQSAMHSRYSSPSQSRVPWLINIISRIWVVSPWHGWDGSGLRGLWSRDRDWVSEWRMRLMSRVTKPGSDIQEPFRPTPSLVSGLDMCAIAERDYHPLKLEWRKITFDYGLWQRNRNNIVMNTVRRPDTHKLRGGRW